MDNVNKVPNFPHNIGVSGRYRAVVHTGHTYDETGQVNGYKEVLQETPFGKNLMTRLFFTDILNNVFLVDGVIVAGAGNTTPTETDSNLTSYLGKCSTCVIDSTQVGDVPGVDGMVYLRTTFRATFNPNSLGTSGSVNVAEGGVAKGSLYEIYSTTPLYSHGLLVDDLGNPTTVSVQVATEYLDLFWEYTRYFKMEDSGTVTIDIDGVPTEHTWVMRPSNWQLRESSATTTWHDESVNSGTISFVSPCCPGTNGDNHNTSSTGLRSGPLGTLEQFASGTIYPMNSATVMAANPSLPKQRSWNLLFTTTNGNVPGGAGALQITGGSFTPVWQISFNPPLAKDTTKQLNLYITCYMDNMP